MQSIPRRHVNAMRSMPTFARAQFYCTSRVLLCRSSQFGARCLATAARTRAFCSSWRLKPELSRKSRPLFSRRYFTVQCVRHFLKRNETTIAEFRDRILRSSAMDEKVSLVDAYLGELNAKLAEEHTWEGAQLLGFLKRVILYKSVSKTLPLSRFMKIVKDSLETCCRTSSVPSKKI